MKINKKLLTIAVLILAVVFTTACNDNDRIVQKLQIDDIWVDKVPDGMLPDPNATEPKQCGKLGRSYILIPSHVQKNSDINIKLYGCWMSMDSISSSCDSFNSFRTSIEENKISLTVMKNYFKKRPCIITKSLHFNKLRREYNITNNFEPGEIEFVVKNPDNEELKETITIE